MFQCVSLFSFIKSERSCVFVPWTQGQLVPCPFYSDAVATPVTMRMNVGVLCHAPKRSKVNFSSEYGTTQWLRILEWYSEGSQVRCCPDGGPIRASLAYAEQEIWGTTMLHTYVAFLCLQEGS